MLHSPHGHSTVDEIVCVGKGSQYVNSSRSQVEKFPNDKPNWGGFEGDVPAQRVCPVLNHIGN